MSSPVIPVNVQVPSDSTALVVNGPTLARLRATLAETAVPDEAGS